MKKYLIIGVTVTLCLAIAFMVSSSIFTLGQRSKAFKNTMVLSSLMGKLQNTVNHHQLENYLKPSLLVYFNSECDYCQRQLEYINDTHEILQYFQLILVSYQDAAEIENYLQNHPNIMDGNYFLYQVAPDEVADTFGKTSTPQLFVYHNNLLAKSFKGITKPSGILKTINR